MSGTTDTVSEDTRSGVRCACGRVHPRPQPRRAPIRRPESDLGSKITDAAFRGEAVQVDGRWYVALHGDCMSPLKLGANDLGRLFATRLVRCRVCGSCRRARTNYWGFAGMEQTRIGGEAGLRTWFGTLTLDPAWQGEFLDAARQASECPNAEWWEDAQCDERFARVRDVLVRETQKMWKRLRKAGHQFKYLIVFERHKSGLPHMHFLLHERGAPIRKKDIQAQWPYGFTNVSIVGGRSARATAPERAAWYVVKYLSKSAQARQLASHGYKPMKRPEPIATKEA